MNLVCGNWLCGVDLVCDLLNGVQSEVVDNYFFNSRASSYFNPHSAMHDHKKFFDILILRSTFITNPLKLPGPNYWYGTRLHPFDIPASMIKSCAKILVISTENYNSRLYQYIRRCNVESNAAKTVFINEANILFPKVNDIDKVTNVEFEDIVNGKFVEENNLDREHFETWKTMNSFLYVQQKSSVLRYFNMYSNIYPIGYTENRWWI